MEKLKKILKRQPQISLTTEQEEINQKVLMKKKGDSKDTGIG